jgi:hypothetical protein
MILIAGIFIMVPAHNPNSDNVDTNNFNSIAAFNLSNNDITYNQLDTKSNPSKSSDTSIQQILDRAKAMTDVKWSPKYNLVDQKGFYVFIKGKTYYGVPYSMDYYQVNSVSDFLNKINNSKTLYGNDCSGFVSAAWGIKRQTTLTLYDAIKQGKTIDGKQVEQISWNDLRPGDALLIDNGKGDGHIMLFIDYDSKNSDNLNVYEQNIPTIIPFEPIPVARRDVRSKKKMMEEGYIPIRIMNIT